MKHLHTGTSQLLGVIRDWAGTFGAVEQARVLLSMDGRWRWMDNRFVERLWLSLKYEDIYLCGYEHGLELRRGVGHWFGDYNERRPHQVLGYATPAEGVSRTRIAWRQTCKLDLKSDRRWR